MSGGTENRTEIMPTTSPEDTGFMQPNYDFGANVRTPKSIGVTVGGTISDVIHAAGGVSYYTDLIGFGQSTNGLTSGMDIKPLGINFFTKTGMTCDNGAAMWQYFQGVPTGNSLGKHVAGAISEMGFPAMRGLAPGMIEDVESALDPRPILQATFGSVHPKCVQTTLPVGDTRGYTKDPITGDVWVQGDVQYRGGVPVQTHWIQAVDSGGNPIYLSADDYNNTPKTVGRDGTALPPPPSIQEGFEGGQKMSLLLAVLFLCTAAAISLPRFK